MHDDSAASGLVCEPSVIGIRRKLESLGMGQSQGDSQGSGAPGIAKAADSGDALAKQIGGAKLRRHEHNSETQRYIQENSIAIPFSGCWIWMRSLTTRGGYGQVGYNTYGTEKAHRLSYTAFHGPCEGKLVCHQCDERACVNPGHLFAGTYLDNHLDMVAKGRGNYARIAKRMRKLTAQDVLAIRASSLTDARLGMLYGVSTSCAGRARRGASYKDLA